MGGGNEGRPGKIGICGKHRCPHACMYGVRPDGLPGAATEERRTSLDSWQDQPQVHEAARQQLVERLQCRTYAIIESGRGRQVEDDGTGQRDSRTHASVHHLGQGIRITLAQLVLDPQADDLPCQLAGGPRISGPRVS